MSAIQVSPDYGDRCLTNVLEAVVDPPRSSSAPLLDLRRALEGSAGVILVILDGLGDLQLDQRSALAPNLHRGRLAPITSVAPSTTAAALSSLTTGVPPGTHGIVGYRFALGGDILQALRWSVADRDAQGAWPPERVQRSNPLLRHRGKAVPYVAKRQFATSGFTKAHLRGADFVGVDGVDGLVGATVDALGRSDVVLCYHDAIDKVAHASGLEDLYDAEIQRAEQLVLELRAAAPDDVAIVVTSDHGQLDVGPSAIELPSSALALVERMSGEGRFRWLHAFPGRRDELEHLVRGSVESTCWVMTRREVGQAGLLGEIDDEVVDRLGDLAVIPHVVAFVPDPAEPKEALMRSRHGSLTPDEMYVPLIVC